MDHALVALGIVMTALTPTIAIITTYLLNSRDRNRKAGVSKRERAEAQVKLDEIHILVNDRLDEALTRIKDLEKSLRIAPGDPIPPRP